MNSALTELISLRVELEKISHQINTLMPDAIAEALSISESLPNSRIVLSTPSGQVVLCLRKHFIQPEEDAKLNRLDSFIKARISRLAQKNQIKLAAIDNQIQELNDVISDLEHRKEKLLSDRYLNSLRKEFFSHQESTAYYKPNLSVYLQRNK
jgi:hypothetical protein